MRSIKKFESFFNKRRTEGDVARGNARLELFYNEFLQHAYFENTKCVFKGKYVEFDQMSTGDVMRLSMDGDELVLTIKGGIFTYHYSTADAGFNEHDYEAIKMKGEQAFDEDKWTEDLGYLFGIFEQSGMMLVVNDYVDEALTEDRWIAKNRKEWTEQWTKEWNNAYRP